VTTVRDPERFGVVELDGFSRIRSIEEKPLEPKSNLAVTGLYSYPTDVFDIVRCMTPSRRGELEITDLNNAYLSQSRLTVNKLLRGMVWFDTGTPESLLTAANFVQMIQNRQGLMIGSPHEVAWTNGWIERPAIEKTIRQCAKSDYGNYLKELTWKV
jgi:glucose-1-phosphate thymidylyltransferase